MLKFNGARVFTDKQGINHVAIPIASNAIFEGKKGLYLSLTLHENKNGQDEWGNNGFASIDLGKERRQLNEKSPIVGNYRQFGEARPTHQNGAPPPSKSATADLLDEDHDDILF